jgi:starvation-inducible DNA-binding protein
MNELIAALRLALGNTFFMYYKTHAYHWNVEGIEFSQYHDFFGDLYDEVYGAVDPTAENLRKLGAYAPISIMELYNYKTITEDSVMPVLLTEMLTNLINANNEVIMSFSKVFDLATAAKEQGLANFAADRMDAHRKHGWMLTASLKKIG